jgi:hypothetical protein
VHRVLSDAEDPHAADRPVRRGIGRRGRFLILVSGGGVGLLAGSWTGLARADVHPPLGPEASHGILMVLGFLGTLIALERAVADGRRWAFAAPACSAAAVLWLVAGGPRLGAALLLASAGLVVTAVYVALLRRRAELAVAIMGGGALAWVLAAVLWATGSSPIALTPLLATFLVLTIVGERLELTRFQAPAGRDPRWLAAACAVLAAGAVLAVGLRGPGLVLAGVGLIAQVAWLVRHDLARYTVRATGLPRYVAVCLLAGYGWLAVSGVLWVVLGSGPGGHLLHDAAVHALFLGFVMSMVFGHAPIVLPAVLGVPLRYHPVAYAPLALLHGSVLVRVVADLAGSESWRGMAAHGNVTALLAFVGVAVVTTLVAARADRRRTSEDARPVG